MVDTNQTPSSPEPQNKVPSPTQTPKPAELNTGHDNPFEDSGTSGAVTQLSAPQATTSNVPPTVDLSTRPSQTSPQQNAPPGDPRVAGLKAMFPDYDEAILLTILEASNGNQEAAIEILLGMNDPEYKPDMNAFNAPPQRTMTQEELDEQLARRLMLEEQDNQVRWQPQAHGPQRRNSSPYDQGFVSPASPGQGGPGGKDTMAEIQESLTKAAEVGKKTIGGLFTKVKAKIQEFEQGRSTTNANQSQWAGGYDPQHNPQQISYAQYHHGSAGAASPPQASYYDPNTPSPVISEQTSSPPNRVPAPVVQGYDASPSSTPAAAAPTQPTPAAPSSAAASSVPPPASNGAPIDGGKLGLLPKRPVSLVRDTPQTRRSYDSDDGLEYAENPFEEQKK